MAHDFPAWSIRTALIIVSDLDRPSIVDALLLHGARRPGGLPPGSGVALAFEHSVSLHLLLREVKGHGGSMDRCRWE
jgi:hypothetical protein